MRAIVIRGIVWLLRRYQRVSRFFPSVCRFRPSCSEYMIHALQAHGLLKGAMLGIWRIMRCNPFTPGGDDPVPSCCSTEDMTGSTSGESDGIGNK